MPKFKIFVVFACLMASCLFDTVTGKCATGTDCYCSEDTFGCATGGGCIDLHHECDGIAHCPDGSDEQNCESFTCLEGTSKICSGYDICKPYTHVCNYEPDCPDGSDEQGCNCDGTFLCGDGSCTHDYFRCDGTDDCLNGMDEYNCTGVTNYEGEGCAEFQCKNGVCISAAAVCDAYNDCGDWSDESFCGQCTHGQIKCEWNDDCINMGQYCDGITDCNDGSDESYCDYNSCDRKTQFRCRDGKCIANYKQCNGEQDCSGGEDESFCNVGTVCNWDQITCGLGTKECISYNQVCDGTPDCTNGNDELNCNCEASSYRYCDGSNQCYLNGQRCDGKIDCLDASDEANCNCDSDREFQCQFSGECMPFEWMCDDVVDCYDASDETKCYHYDCSADEFKCDGGRCLPQSDVCNGIQDCPMGEDEKDCYHCVAWNDMRTCNDGDMYNMWQGVYKGTITLAQMMTDQCTIAQGMVDCIMEIAQRYENDTTCTDFAHQAQEIALNNAASFAPHCHIQLQGDTPMEDCGGKTATQISTITGDCRDSAFLDFSNVTNLCDSLLQFSTCMTDNQITCAFAMNYIWAIEAMILLPQDSMFRCNSTYIMFGGGHNEWLGIPNEYGYECYDELNQCTRHPVSTFAGHGQVPLNNVTTMMAELQLIGTFFGAWDPYQYIKMIIYYREQICRLVNDEDMMTTTDECLDDASTTCSYTDYYAAYEVQTQFQNINDSLPLCSSECDNALEIQEAVTACVAHEDHGGGYFMHILQELTDAAMMLKPVQQQCTEIERMYNCVIGTAESCPYIKEAYLLMGIQHANEFGAFCHVRINATIDETGCENTAAISANVTACNERLLYDPANPSQTCTNIEAYYSCMESAVSSCMTLQRFYTAHYSTVQMVIELVFNCKASMFGMDVYQSDPCDEGTTTWNCLKPALIHKYEEASGVTGNTMIPLTLEVHQSTAAVVLLSHEIFMQDLQSQMFLYSSLTDEEKLTDAICRWKAWPELNSTLHCLDDAMYYPTYNSSCGAHHQYKSTFTASSKRNPFSPSKSAPFWSAKKTKGSSPRHKRADYQSTTAAPAYENFYEDTYPRYDYSDYSSYGYHYEGHYNGGYYSYAQMPKEFINEVVDTVCDPDCENMGERAEELMRAGERIDIDKVMDSIYTALQQRDIALVEQSCSEIGDLFNMGFNSIGSCGTMWDWFKDPAYCMQESVAFFCHLNFTLQIQEEGCDYGERSGKLLGCLKNAEFDPQDATKSCSTLQSFGECARDAIHGCQSIMEFYGVFLLEKLKGATAIFNCDWTLTIPGEDNIVFKKQAFQCDRSYMEMSCGRSLALGAMLSYSTQGVPPTMYNVPLIVQSAMIVMGESMQEVMSGQVENKELFCSLTSMINMTEMMGCEDDMRSCYDSGSMSRDGEDMRICGKYDQQRQYNPEYEEPQPYDHESNYTQGYKQYLKIKMAAKKSVQVTPFRKMKYAMKKALKKSPITQRQSMNYDEALEIANNLADGTDYNFDELKNKVNENIDQGTIDDLKNTVYDNIDNIDQGTIDDLKNTVYNNIDNIDQGTIDDLKNTVYDNMDGGDKSSGTGGGGDYSNQRFEISEETSFIMMRNFICNPDCAGVLSKMDELDQYFPTFGKTAMYILQYGKDNQVCDEYLRNMDRITEVLGGCIIYGISEEIDRVYSAAPICGRQLDDTQTGSGGGASMVEANWTTLSVTLGVTFISLSLAHLLESFI